LQGRIVERYKALPANKSFSFGENLSPGMYSVVVKNGDGAKMIKAVKM